MPMSSSFFAPRRSRAKTTNPSDRDRDSKADNHQAIRVCPPKQLPPLETSSSWTSKIQYLTPNRSSWILHVPRFCRSSSSSLSEFWKTRPTHQHPLMLFGKRVLENRYSAMYSTNETIQNYTYSGSSRPCKVCDASQPHEKFILDLCATADGIVGQLLTPTRSVQSETAEGLATSTATPRPIYNACLVNWYAPQHTIGLHSDDEPELDTSWPIFSLSWGGPRRFLLRPKPKTRAKTSATTHSNVTPTGVHEVILRDGDLLVMGGNCQDEFKHEIPKVRSTMDGLVGNRISWTIRRLRPKKVHAATTKVRSATSNGMASRKEGEIGKTHSQHGRSGATKRMHGESSESSHLPRKRGAIYNPYAKSRG